MRPELFRQSTQPETEGRPTPGPVRVGEDGFPPRIPTPNPTRASEEIFYRFVPADVAPLVEAGQYDKLWVPAHMSSQENFISQDFRYVNGLAISTAAQKGPMTVLQINTKLGTFDYLTNPNNARLHSGVSRDWLTGQRVNYDVMSYQTFGKGDGSNYLQLKQERDALTIGFFQANAHKWYFERQINSVKSVETHLK